MDGGFGAPGLGFADGAGVVCGVDCGINGGGLGVAGVDAEQVGADEAGGGVAEDGGEGDLERKRVLGAAGLKRPATA